MDSKHPQPASPAPLKYQTWFLKVSIHCEGCRRKVKKVLQSIDGVFTTTIDQQQQKVTVTGSVAVETLLRKLLRAGKHAEIWPENLTAGKPKKNSNTNNKGKDTESLKNQSSEKQSSNNNKESKSSSNKSKTGENSPGKSASGEHSLPENHNGDGRGGSSKKKKKKGSCGAPAHTGLLQCQNEWQDVGREMGQVNLSPTRQQQQYLYDPSESGYYYAYNRFYNYNNHNHNHHYNPMMGRVLGGPFYYVPPSPSPLPFMCASIDQFQSKPLVSFEIFSDENANGCSVM